VVACGGATTGTIAGSNGSSDAGGTDGALASSDGSAGSPDGSAGSLDRSAPLGADAAADGPIGTPCSNSYDCFPADGAAPAFGIACGASGRCEACTTNGLNDPCLGGPPGNPQNPDCCAGLRCVNLRCVP